MGEKQGYAKVATPHNRASFPRLTLSLSAFIMSLTITLISAYHGLQGAEVLVRAPDQIILYRNGHGKNSVLTVAVRTDMINSASDYGDVLLEAELTPQDGGPAFRYDGIVNTVFTASRDEGAKDCALISRCIRLPQLLIVEQPDELVSIPGGSAQPYTLTFSLVKENCINDVSACNRFSNFEQAVLTLSKIPININISLNFHSDGNRQISCGGLVLSRKSMALLGGPVGWMSFKCVKRKVTGEPFL